MRPVGSQSAEGDCVQSTGAGEAIQRRSASVNFSLCCVSCVAWESRGLVWLVRARAWVAAFEAWLWAARDLSGAEHQGKRRRHGLLKKSGNCRE